MGTCEVCGCGHGMMHKVGCPNNNEPICAGCEDLQNRVDSLGELNHDLTQTNCKHVKMINKFQEEIHQARMDLKRVLRTLGEPV
jgi:hypothetical protein